MDSYTGVEGGAKDENRKGSSSAIDESARVMPVEETESRGTLDSTRHVDDSEKIIGDEADDLHKREPELGLTKGGDAEELESAEDKLDESQHMRMERTATQLDVPIITGNNRTAAPYRSKTPGC
jgi:hypothetical protein